MKNNLYGPGNDDYGRKKSIADETEDLLRAKELFRSQYWGQEVLVHEVNGHLYEIDSDFIEQPGYLLLRSVDMLTDEEVKLIGWGSSEQLNLCFSYFSSFENFTKRWLSYSDLQVFLRIGILIPFTYISTSGEVITLSTDRIIELEWAKIKSK